MRLSEALKDNTIEISALSFLSDSALNGRWDTVSDRSTMDLGCDLKQTTTEILVRGE
jgi:hypothetical protein